jgi:hypothetical protein
MDEEFLTVMEIAEMLKVNPMTVPNWIFSTVFGVRRCLSVFEDGASAHRPELPEAKLARRNDARKKRRKCCRWAPRCGSDQSFDLSGYRSGCSIESSERSMSRSGQ